MGCGSFAAWAWGCSDSMGRKVSVRGCSKQAVGQGLFVAAFTRQNPRRSHSLTPKKAAPQRPAKSRSIAASHVSCCLYCYSCDTACVYCVIEVFSISPALRQLSRLGLFLRMRLKLGRSCHGGCSCSSFLTGARGAPCTRSMCDTPCKLCNPV